MNLDWTGGLTLLAVLALVVYPAGRILRRMGFSPLLVVVTLIPFVNLIALWIVAFIDWPAIPNDEH